MKNILKISKKLGASFMIFAFALTTVGIVGGAPTKAEAATTWNVAGSHVMTMTYNGDPYLHNVTFAQDGSNGNLTGSGSHNAYAWTINTGTVVNDTVSFTANYTATDDAVTPTQTVMTVTGTIAGDGSITGTWSDNYLGGARNGDISMPAGTATVLELPGTLVAEEFIVLIRTDHPAGHIKGYSAGFRVDDGTFDGASSTVVKLYAADNQLLQTNTLIQNVPANQITAPFDVSGTFVYTTDGYWTNVREAEYGQSVPAVKVVAEVTLANGKVLTVENTSLTNGGVEGLTPEDIYPPAPKIITKPTTMITHADATLNGTNGDENAVGHSFWASLNTFSTASPVIPSGVYSTPDLGAINADTDFSALLSSTGITVTPNTTYHFAAWSTVDGTTWNPGQIMTFTTGSTTSTSTGDIDGEVVGGVLEVTSIEKTQGTAIANDTFESGWKYTFNITLPTNETDLSMKFSDWTLSGASSTIATANNVRISSAQASATSTVLVTAADTYSTPALTMVTDLNPEIAGIQVQVIVEVKIPVGSANGSYSTNYGVKTQ